jgi:hypothetical protein
VLFIPTKEYGVIGFADVGASRYLVDVDMDNYLNDFNISSSSFLMGKS